MLVGEAGDDKLYNAVTKTVLSGGAGKDAFIFNTKAVAKNANAINDFVVKEDTIQLDNAIFKKLGKAGGLKKAYFTIGSKAKDKNDYVIYDKAKGTLSYDADGSDKKYKAQVFATLDKNLKLSHTDFFVV
jgi:Ca2+-binding RTX toxin-like protein